MKIRNGNLISLVIIAAAICPAWAGDLQRTTAVKVASYQKASGAVVGVSAVDLRTGKTLIDFRSERLFTPASNQKILTSAFALAELGGDFKFTTSVYRIGQDLLIVGDGDPTLGDPRLAADANSNIYAELDRWATAVASKLAGQPVRNVLLHSALPLKSSRHPDWPKNQYHRWYAAPVSGLNFHNNCFDVTFTVSGARAVGHVSPASRFITVTGGVKVGKKHVWSLRPSQDDSVLKLTGSVRKSAPDPLSTAANNPSMLLGRVFADRLARKGVTVTGQIAQVSADKANLAGAELVCQSRTPLAVAIKRANKRSLNMAAECIFLRAGDGTWAGSAAKMNQSLTNHFNLPAGSIKVRDGSGLSHGNRISPAAMTKLLSSVAFRPDALILLESLPFSGIDGGLRKRMKSAPYRGRAAAKTGYVDGVSCLSGYVLDGESRPAIAFSVLVNNVPLGKASRAKRLQDELCKLMVDSLE